MKKRLFLLDLALTLEWAGLAAAAKATATTTRRARHDVSPAADDDGSPDDDDSGSPVLEHSVDKPSHAGLLARALALDEFAIPYIFRLASRLAMLLVIWKPSSGFFRSTFSGNFEAG